MTRQSCQPWRKITPHFSISDTGQMLVGGSTVEGGWGRGSYGLESQGLESVASLSSPTAFFFQSLGYTSFTITCSAALGGPHRASDWPLIIFQDRPALPSF